MKIKTIRMYHFDDDLIVTIWLNRYNIFQVNRLLCGCSITGSLYPNSRALEKMMHTFKFAFKES